MPARSTKVKGHQKARRSAARSMAGDKVPARTAAKRDKPAATSVTRLAKLFTNGGIIYVPPEAYLRRLRSLYQSGNAQAHANTLYPGIAHVATIPEAGLISLFRSILTASEAGRNLHGLESLFLSCLQGLQKTGSSQLAVAGIAAWARHTPAKRKWPLVIVDRRTNQFMFIPAQHAAQVLPKLTASTLLRSSVWDELKLLEGERAIVTTLGSLDTGVNESDAAQDCKDKVGAWANIMTGLITVAAWVAAAAAKTDIGLVANVAQLVGAVLTGIAGLIGTYGCSSPGQEQDTSDPGEWDGWGDVGVEPSGEPSDMGDYVVPDADDTLGEYADNSDPAAEPPDPADATGTALPNPDDPGASWAMPNPDDAGESHSMPPGYTWHRPGSEMPDPNDIGGGGPVSFPNGAVFVPTLNLGIVASVARMAVSAQMVGASKSGVATFQLSASSTALGAS